MFPSHLYPYQIWRDDKLNIIIKRLDYSFFSSPELCSFMFKNGIAV